MARKSRCSASPMRGVRIPPQRRPDCERHVAREIAPRVMDYKRKRDCGRELRDQSWTDSVRLSMSLLMRSRFLPPTLSTVALDDVLGVMPCIVVTIEVADRDAEQEGEQRELHVNVEGGGSSDRSGADLRRLGSDLLIIETPGRDPRNGARTPTRTRPASALRQRARGAESTRREWRRRPDLSPSPSSPRASIEGGFDSA